MLIGFDDDESTRYEIRLSKPVDPRVVYSFLPWPWTTPILSLFAKQAKHVTEKSKRQKVRLRCGSACVCESTREGLSATEVVIYRSVRSDPLQLSSRILAVPCHVSESESGYSPKESCFPGSDSGLHGNASRMFLFFHRFGAWHIHTHVYDHI